MKEQKKELTLKVTNDEKIFIKTAAAKKGLPVNKYVLDLVKEDTEKEVK